MTLVTSPPLEPAAAEDAGVVLFARQPILDASSAVQGHELLFRREDGSGWPVGDEAKATAHVLVSAFADLGLPAVTGQARAWVNVPRSFLLETDLSVLPADRVVIELLERNVLDAAYVARLAGLAGAGYQLALDDFEWDDEMMPVLELATYVKLDLRALGVDGVADHVQRLTPYGVRIVAEKVETADERDACLALGIDLFQGYFFERPRLVRGRPAPHAALRRLRIATSLGANASFEDVERVLMLDPGLSMRLLRYINSAAVALRARVSSLRQALMLVGTDTVRQWMLLVLLGDLGRVQPAVLTSGLVRARVCEQLARARRVRTTDSAFIVGLLSVSDALLGAPLDEVITGLPLTEDVRDAIIGHEGPLGELLSRAIELQHGDTRAGTDESQILAEALRWSEGQLTEFTSTF
jgi:c-di-GMP phosphodiesterase